VLRPGVRSWDARSGIELTVVGKKDVKYVLILGFMALLVIMAPKYLGHDISNVAHDISNTLNGAATSLHTISNIFNNVGGDAAN
jgi:Flp pilus assembly pilin Flp